MLIEIPQEDLMEIASAIRMQMLRVTDVNIWDIDPKIQKIKRLANLVNKLENGQGQGIL